ncbi:pilus assembly PilX N-terminal domain-containing protein [Paraliobacillus zengyii]|uniref:pilus assembly PilX N-terminal domain-containing protein n=1 Tax=Paraliobacillus zengyii TaxID=2213194 RepID=UPI000DD4801A|nr:pilus assembly PilX N-terminal domain-containing protein [Paraliobacillus zengyii]
MQKHYKYIKNNQDGAILVIVMMALTVLSLLGLALATASFANIKLTTVDRDYQATYYVAEGGANQTYAEIETLVESIYETTNTEASFYSDLNSRIEQQLDGTSISDFEESFTEQPSAKVKVEQVTDGNPRSYQIVSEGIIGKRTRTVTKPFQVNWKSGSGGSIEIPDNAVAIVKNSISLVGSVSLNGDLYVDSTLPNLIKMDGTTHVYGIAYVPENAVENALKIHEPENFKGTIPEVKSNLTSIPWEDYQTIIDNHPTYPTYSPPIDETIGGEYERFKVIEGGNLNINSYQANGYTLNLDKNLQFNRITFASNNTLNINTNNEDHDIVVKDLDLSQGHINIIGSGKVNIYIQDSFNIGGSSTINDTGNTNQLNMYYQGTSRIEVSNAQYINGSIFVEKADVKLTGGGDFQGFIVSGGNSVVFEGGTYSSAFVIAPNADLVFSGSGSINGTVITNSITGTGGGFIKFKSMNLDDFPFGTNSSPSTDDLIKKQPTVESD